MPVPPPYPFGDSFSRIESSQQKFLIIAGGCDDKNGKETLLLQGFHIGTSVLAAGGVGTMTRKQAGLSY